MFLVLRMCVVVVILDLDSVYSLFIGEVVMCML